MRVLRALGAYDLLGSAAHTQRLLRRLSGVWFFLYCGMLFFGVFFWTGDWREFFRLPFSKPLVVVPAGYLGFCFCTSFARRRSWWLLLAGALAHGLLVMVVAQNASAEILGRVFMLAGLYISIVWWWMYATLEPRGDMPRPKA